MVLAAAIPLLAHSPACAEEVFQEHLGLHLRGNFEVAPAKSLEKDGVALILHGTLAHNGMEIIRDLQANLGRRGISTLAVTLSLGLDRRTGMFDCALEHDHRHSDAVEELAAWFDWLREKGATRIDLIGHSRGGAQAALFTVDNPARLSGKLVLVAPLLENTPGDVTADRYAAQFGKPLGPLLETARKSTENGDGSALLEVPGFLNCRDARVTAKTFVDYYGGTRPSVPGLLQRVKAPTLVVAAGADEIVPDVVDAIKAAALPANVTLREIDGSDHFFRDLYGEDLADEIASFLRRD